jgi:hypothetical protein
MKITMLIVFAFIVSSVKVNAQQLMGLVKDKISDHLYATLNKSDGNGNRFSGGIEVIDAKNENGYTYIKGTFKYRMVYLIGDDKIVVKKFRAKLKTVLDDISVICFSYVGVNEDCYYYLTDSKTGKETEYWRTQRTNSECTIYKGSLMDPCGSW